MHTVLYDGSFEGWLTAVFEIYEYGFSEAEIQNEGKYQRNMFTGEHFAITNEYKATRLWNGLKQRLSLTALQQINNAWFSEMPGIENTLLAYVQYVFNSKISIEKDYSCAAVLTITNLSKKVHREKHRMEAFVRFQLTADGLYYAIVEPDFNVLSLIMPHFEARYADQRWMIYDARRKYGIYYDLHKVEFVHIQFDSTTNGGKDIHAIYDEREDLYQHLWKHYFDSVNIKARKNTKLHIQHMPQRYWKYLPEKV